MQGMRDNNMKFNKRLRQLRHTHNLTQKELAKVLGLKPTAISNYESERNEPSLDKLIALSKFFDVSCDYLLGVSDSHKPLIAEVDDKETLEFLELYKQLSPSGVSETKNYIQYLLYKEKSKEKASSDRL